MRYILSTIMLLICLSTVLEAQDASQKQLDSLASVYRTLQDTDTNKVVVCHEIAYAYDNIDSTILWSDSLVRLASLNNMPLYRVKAYGYISWSYSQKDDYETALSYNYRSLLLADSLGDIDLKAWCYYRMGSIYYYLSNMELSDRYFNNALASYRSIGDTVWMANCIRTIADNYSFQKMFDQSISKYWQAIELDSLVGNNVRTSDDYVGLGKTYYRMFLFLSDSSALQALDSSVIVLRKAFNFDNRNIRSRYFVSRYLLDALFCVHKYSTSDSKRRQGLLDSMQVLAQSLDTLRMQMGFERARLRGRLSFVNYLIAKGDLPKAGYILDSLKGLVLDNQYKTIHDVFYWVCANYYEAIGDYKSAMHYSTLFYKYLLNEQSVDFAVKSTANQMRMQYEDSLLQEQESMRAFRTNIKIILTAILLLVGALVFFYYHNSRHKNLMEHKNLLLQAQSEEISSQRDILAQRNKQITDSVNYAKTIQMAVQPKEDFMRNLFPEHFIIYKPLHIVSGDFYWARRRNGREMLVCADCTGHGVPGGFLSMLGISILNDLTAVLDPALSAAQILDTMRAMLMKALGQSKQKYDNGIIYSMDGIDLALLMVDRAGHQLQYAGAYRPLLIWRNGVIETHKPDKMPIGLYLGPEKDFSNNIIEIEDGDMLYVFSDGMPDQFGYVDDSHQECAHYSSKRFARLLAKIGGMPMEEQKDYVEREFDQWRNGYPQLDDNILIGVRI